MIIKSLLSLVTGLIRLLPFDPITFDDQFFTYVAEAWQLIKMSIDILGVFIGPVGMRAIGLFLGLVLFINVGYFSWQMFWFIVHKIPMLNIKQ